MSSKNTVETLFNVKGLVAVITGGGTGIGLYAARALDANGAKAVYVIGRREETLRAAAKTGINGTIKPIVGDVSSKESLAKIADQVRREQGYVNFLFANAGFMGTSDRAKINELEKGSAKFLQSVLWQHDSDEYTKTLDINVTGAYFTVVAFLDLLEAGNKTRNLPQDSSVLITSSVAGFSRHITNSFAYSTSKAAVNHLVKTLSTLLGQQELRIRVNGINPGFYPSEMTSGLLKGMDQFQQPGHEGVFEGALASDATHSPAARSGSEQDIAGLVLFLASQAGAFINGETLITDGGRLTQLPSAY